jgi:uncharacterized protein YjbI with pentapeptide repeats
VKISSQLELAWIMHRRNWDGSEKRLRHGLVGLKASDGILYLPVDLRFADLSSIRLHDLVLWSGNFTNANLTKAQFERCSLSQAIFDGADLQYATILVNDMVLVSLAHANLCHTSLRNILFIKANFTGACMQYADLSHAVLYDARLDSVDVANANLSFANLRNISIKDTDLTKATLTGAMITLKR